MRKPRLFPQSLGLVGCLLLLVAAFVFGKMQGGFVPWFLFYAFLLVVLYEGFVFWFAVKGLEVKRTLSKNRLYAGDRLDVTVTVTCRSRFPVPWLWVVDRLPEGFASHSPLGERLLFPWFHKEMLFSYRCEHVLRGRHQWQTVHLQSGDLFGFVQRTKQIALHDEALVYPKIRDISVWYTVNERNTGTSLAQNRMSEDVTSVIGVRDYVHGDRLSRIHWKATARGMGLKTKEFEFQVTNDFMFFLDRRTEAYGSERHPLFERAVSLVASLSQYAIKRRFSVGLVSYGKQRVVLPLNRNPETMYALLEHLAEVKADSQFPLNQTLWREVPYLTFGTTIVCVTPQLDRDLVGAIHILSDRHLKIEVFWVRVETTLSERESKWLRALEPMGVTVRIVANDNFAEFG